MFKQHSLSMTSRRDEDQLAPLGETHELFWARPWWNRLRGRARVLDEGEEREYAIAAAGEVAQYRTEPPEGPVLAVEVIDVRA